MIAELDPAVILQLCSDEDIHACIQYYTAPPGFIVAPLQQGMNMFNM